MAGSNRSKGCAGRQRRSATADSTTLEDQCHPRKIFIGGLAGETTAHDLRTYFGRFGGIVDAVVLRWPDGRSRGFGYVTFSDVRSASAVLAVSHCVGGQEVEVKPAVPGTNKLFVGGLPQSTMAAELRGHFEAFGVVSDAVVMIDPATGRSRGFGFVCFAPGQEGAAAVAMALDQYKSHRIRGKWIEVKSAARPHRFASREHAGEPEPVYSAAAALPGQAPSSILRAPATREATQLWDGSTTAPLPNLLEAGGFANPKKVMPPPGLAPTIGAPPGLCNAFEVPRKVAATGNVAEIDAAGPAGCILWLGAGAAAANRKPWLGAPPPLFSSWSGPSLTPGLPALLPVMSGGSAPGPTSVLPQKREPGSAASANLSVALQQSLEKLVRLKMCSSSAAVSSDGLAKPAQLAVA